MLFDFEWIAPAVDVSVWWMCSTARSCKKEQGQQYQSANLLRTVEAKGRLHEPFCLMS